MKSSFHLSPQPGRGRLAAPVALAIVLALAGCGNKKESAPSQTAAKVNKEEITVHQINFVLQQQRGLRPEQTDAASKQILERLIDQELAVQKASELKLDREPRVVQAVEAAKRDILARAYIEKASDNAAKPTPEEVRKYYEAKPALFKERRVYNLQELAIEATPAQVETLRAKLSAAKSVNEFIEYLNASGIRYAANEVVRAAEQLPLSMLDTFARMKDGQTILTPTPNGVQVVVVASSRSAPVDEARAKPAIEQYLLNESKRKVAEADMKALRAAANIQYVGSYAQAASAPAAAPALASSSAPAVAAPSAAASGGLSASDISRGMGFSK